LKIGERDTATCVEADAFALEEAPLPRVVPRRRADSALCIHDALPRNRCVGGQRVERVAHEARLTREAGEARHLPVGRYAAAWYP
jgi:hypothetical protein